MGSVNAGIRGFDHLAGAGLPDAVFIQILNVKGIHTIPEFQNLYRVDHNFIFKDGADPLILLCAAGPTGVGIIVKGFAHMLIAKGSGCMIACS